MPRIGHRRRQWTDVIDRARQRYAAARRQFVVAGLQPDDAAGGGGDTDGAAGVTAEAAERHAR